MKFQIGDRVRLIYSDPSGNKNLFIGSLGTVCHISLPGNIGVEFDNEINGHDCCGTCAYKHGWFVSEKDIVFARDDKFEECSEADIKILFM